MITCSNCGHENADEAKICERCAQPLDANTLPPPRLLAQIQGLIPPEPIISTGQLSGNVDLSAIGVREKAAEPEVDALLVAGAAVIASQIAEPESEVVEPAPWLESDQRVAAPPPLPPHVRHKEPAKEQPSRLPLVLALLALLLVIAGLRYPLAGDVAAPRRPSVETAYTYIEILPERPQILLAWDYEPTTQGEMQLFALPILQHLYQKGARIANVSLRPTGPAVAAAAMAQFNLLRPPGIQSIPPRPVDFGFIPGDAVALRSLSVATVADSNLSAMNARTLGFGPDDTVESFDLIIEFSAETATSQEWVEQIATRLDIPVIMVASGAVAPVLRPYEQTNQIAALMSGYGDALAYERLLHIQGPATSQHTAQTLLHLLLIGVVCIALIRSVFR